SKRDWSSDVCSSDLHHERDPDVLVPVVRGYAAQGSVTPVLRAIPSTGERIPALGLGTWQAFDVGDPARRGSLREVLRRFVDLGEIGRASCRERVGAP